MGGNMGSIAISFIIFFFSITNQSLILFYFSFLCINSFDKTFAVMLLFIYFLHNPLYYYRRATLSRTLFLFVFYSFPAFSRIIRWFYEFPLFAFCNVFVIARKLFEKTIYKQNDLEIKWNVRNLFSVQVGN